MVKQTVKNKFENQAKKDYIDALDNDELMKEIERKYTCILIGLESCEQKKT